MDLVRGTPGRRFSARYRHRRRNRTRLEHWLALSGGIALMAVGTILFFTPGPGLLFFGAGAVLMARESHGAARFFDRVELRLRAGYRALFPR